MRTSDFTGGKEKKKKGKHLDTILEKNSQAGVQHDPDFQGLTTKQKEPLMDYHLI